MGAIKDILNSKCAARNPHLAEKQVKDKGKLKYGNNKKEVDGIVFDSEKEAKRYGVLKTLLKYGAIGLLELQVPFELNQDGNFSYKYIADFVFTDAATGERIVEDCKGFRTAVYKKKKRLMKKIHGIEIKET